MRVANPLLRKANWIELAFGISVVCFLASCTELKRPEPNPYLAETQPPPMQELRWNNGPKPKSLDPAFAAAAPETDIVRAVYEGLTTIDPRTLDALPGVAEEWTVSADGKTWTFNLRKDAKWSNGKNMTADDFVRSWQRLTTLGERTAHRTLLDNLARVVATKVSLTPSEPVDFVKPPEPTAEASPDNASDEAVETIDTEPSNVGTNAQVSKLEIKATDQYTLNVTLIRPDPDFPKVVANPIFSPIAAGTKSNSPGKIDSRVVTNGAFKIAKVEDSGVTVERSETYWNRESVKLDRIAFIALAKPDETLDAYRTGKVDVVTNTEFAPLAQKVFSPYSDFRKGSYAALNFYEINYRKAPFNDRRVREALAISIEREKLSDGELEGTTQPAFSFLPFAHSGQVKIVQDKDRARELFEQAGFADGVGFPVVRLVVNRNDLQQRVARAVARMWKANLNVEAEIIVKEPAELNEIRAAQDFDVLRRVVVLPVASEAASLSVIFGDGKTDTAIDRGADLRAAPMPSPTNNGPSNSVNTEDIQSSLSDPITESQALFELHAIPLYFPASFALVKPYVSGFEMNSLEAQSAAAMSIDSTWQPQRQ